MKFTLLLILSSNVFASTLIYKIYPWNQENSVMQTSYRANSDGTADLLVTTSEKRKISGGRAYEFIFVSNTYNLKVPDLNFDNSNNEFRYHGTICAKLIKRKFRRNLVRSTGNCKVNTKDGVYIINNGTQPTQRFLSKDVYFGI